MTGRRGIFFNSKSRSIDNTNVILEENISNPLTATLSSQDDSSNSPPKTSASAGIGKKKLILKNTKRTLNKTIYSGPRKIFSTSYKANRAQLNHKAFFGADLDEYDLASTERVCSSQTTTVTKRTMLVKSKSTDNFRTTTTTTTTTITENGKTKIICPRDQKKMYTVVPNIRQPTTCEELGETQSYIDDMEYLLAGIQSDKILSSRCLSAIKFAELCSKASFRMHLRTESALERVFELLKDAPDIPSLNLCTALIFYILSSDTLTSGITPSTLRFMIELVQKSSLKNENDDEYTKIKQKIIHFINQTNQDEIFYEQKFNTCDLILETLVNITRNHLKDWLRNEARMVNVFDIVIDSISSIVQDLSNNDFECYSIGEIIIRYRKVCRYINMLEEFSSNNQQQSEQTTASSQTINLDLNRLYIVQYHQYLLFHSLSKLLDLSLMWFQEHSSSEPSKMSDTCEIFRDGCKTILLFLIVLTNDCELHCDHLTSDDRFLSNLLRLLVIIEHSSLPNEDKFDALALALNLLINLVQNTKHLYKFLMENHMPGESSQKIYEYLAHIFYTHELLAAKAESQEENDWMMEEEEDDLDERLGIQNTKNVNNENNGNFNRALQKATGHMENTFVAAFAGIILGVVLLRDHLTYANQIKNLLPDKSFDTLAFILKKFFSFLRMSHAFTPSGVKTLEEIITLIFSLRE